MMMTFGQWQCGEGKTIDEDEKHYERVERKKVASSVEMVVA
jgi:hypothetical protein